MKASEGLIRVLVDAGRDDRLFTKYGVTSMPTIIFLDPEGKQVGKLADRSPGGVETQFSEISSKHMRGPKWMPGSAEALAAGKSDGKPVVLLFADDKPRSQQFARLFADPSFKADLLEKCAFARVEFKKDSDECKKWKVSEAPTILIVDGTSEEPKVLKTIKTARAADIRKDLEDAVKKVSKK